jgi:hypothetical protein
VINNIVLYGRVLAYNKIIIIIIIRFFIAGVVVETSKQAHSIGNSKG